MTRFLLVCCGGAVGSGLRYLLAGWVGRNAPGAFPWGTLAVNLLGCFALEMVLRAAARAWLSPVTLLLLSTGLMGGFTTYSAFNSQLLELARLGAWGLAAAYVGATVIGCLLAGLLGFVLGNALFAA